MQFCLEAEMGENELFLTDKAPPADGGDPPESSGHLHNAPA